MRTEGRHWVRINSRFVEVVKSLYLKFRECFLLVLASTTEKKVLLLMDGLMDELILILREYFRSTRQTNYDVVYITDDSSEHCIFITYLNKKGHLLRQQQQT